MYINVNLKKPDHRGISQILATPGEGKGMDVEMACLAFPYILWHP